MSSQIELAEQVLAEHRKIETEMSSPEALSSPEKMKSLGRRYAELGRVVRVYQAYRRAEADLSETREIVEAGGEDAEAGASGHGPGSAVDLGPASAACCPDNRWE